MSNAVQASAGLTGSRFAGQWAPGTPPVRVWLSADEHRVVIQVWDGSDRPPVPQPVEPEADSGRGLLLVGCAQRGVGLLHAGEVKREGRLGGGRRLTGDPLARPGRAPQALRPTPP